MYEAANRLGEMRGDLIGCMCAITGKTVVGGGCGSFGRN